MDILIITYTRTKNYGGILQAYGLYQYISSMGYHVKFIDYIPRRCNIYDRSVFIDCASEKSRWGGKNFITKVLWGLIKYKNTVDGYAPFIKFMDSNAKFTEKYFSYEDLKTKPPAADLYITGSDQVWNSDFIQNQNLDLPFYLGFVKKGRKISYASSFGGERIPPKNEIDITRYLSQYNRLSVREITGKEILSKLGLQSSVVVDPTLLCDPGIWDDLCCKNFMERDYLVFYQVKSNPQLYNFTVRLAKSLNLKLIVLSMNASDKRYIKSKLILTPTIEEWLTYIKYADAVLTDSFHASVFSIIFKKKFLVNTGVRKGMASRIEHLLSNLELSQRIIKDFDLKDIVIRMNQEINWEKVCNTLYQMQTKSRKWLIEAIEDHH